MRLRLKALVVVLLVSLFVAVMIPCMYNRYIQGETLYYVSKVDAFREENKTLPRGGVVFLGDSITDFCDLDKFYPGLDAVNRGIAGDVTFGVLRRMEESVYALEPRLVVLLIGINDIARAHRPETTLENIREIISEIRLNCPDTAIIVQSVYPVSPRWRESYAKRNTPLVKELNAGIEELAAEFGCTFANIYPYLVGDDGYLIDEYTYDGLHPNDKGYEVISSHLRPIIDEVLGTDVASERVAVFEPVRSDIPVRKL